MPPFCSKLRLPQGRPRLQFSLATLLVAITLLCVWLGSHAAAVQRRNAMRAWIEERGGELDHYVFDKPYPQGYVPPDWYFEKLAQYPKVRNWFGDRAVCYVYLWRAKNVNSAEREEIALLFPEAYVFPPARIRLQDPE